MSVLWVEGKGGGGEACVCVGRHEEEKKERGEGEGEETEPQAMWGAHKTGGMQGHKRVGMLRRKVFSKVPNACPGPSFLLLFTCLGERKFSCRKEGVFGARTPKPCLSVCLHVLSIWISNTKAYMR